LYEIEIDKDFGLPDWYDFLKNMLREIVLKDKKATLLIAEN